MFNLFVGSSVAWNKCHQNYSKWDSIGFIDLKCSRKMSLSFSNLRYVVLTCVLQVLGSFPLPTWTSAIAVADIDRDGVAEVIIGCRDNSVHGLKLIVSWRWLLVVYVDIVTSELIFYFICVQSCETGYMFTLCEREEKLIINSMQNTEVVCFC